MAKKKRLYPSVEQADAIKNYTAERKSAELEQPDFVAGAPNYDKYKGVEPERVLVWLNID